MIPASVSRPSGRPEDGPGGLSRRICRGASGYRAHFPVGHQHGSARSARRMSPTLIGAAAPARRHVVGHLGHELGYRHVKPDGGSALPADRHAGRAVRPPRISRPFGLRCPPDRPSTARSCPSPLDPTPLGAAAGPEPDRTPRALAPPITARPGHGGADPHGGLRKWRAPEHSGRPAPAVTADPGCCRTVIT